MPEGPECKFYVDALNLNFADDIITGVKIISGRYTHQKLPGLSEFKFPVKLLKVKTKGKFIYFELDNGSFIWNTLGMSGSWALSKNKSTRLEFSFGDKKLYFEDQRNFGTFKFGQSALETKKKLKSLGLDFLTEDVSIKDSYDLFKLKRNQNNTLAQILMNQKNYAGVGNYIKAEVLYRAKLSPHRLGSSLSQDDILNLHTAIKDVMIGSYRSKFKMFAQYQDMDGCGAEFKKVIYKKSVCPLGNPIVAEETLDKRVTHWVPSVQK